ncbi:MAG TPA: hypothetical protein DIC37_13605, partial [Pseudomonas sp.]|nr:hypothetical protein [Pseudomonas sp.]
AMGRAAAPTFPDAKLHTLNLRHLLFSPQFAKPSLDSLQTPSSPSYLPTPLFDAKIPRLTP